MAGVVDVFASAGEVHKLGGLKELGSRIKFGLDPVLDRLDVMVSGLFYFLDGAAIGLRKILHQAQQVSARSGRKRLEFSEARVTQCNEPRNLNLNTALHVALFTHQWAQLRQFGGVASIQRREGGNCRKTHGRNCRWHSKPLAYRCSHASHLGACR